MTLSKHFDINFKNNSYILPTGFLKMWRHLNQSYIQAEMPLFLCSILNPCFTWIYPHVSRLAQSSITLEILKCLVCTWPFLGSATTEISSSGDPSIPTAYSSIFFDVYFFTFDLFQRFNSLHRNIGPRWISHCIFFHKTHISHSVLLSESWDLIVIITSWYQIK